MADDGGISEDEERAEAEREFERIKEGACLFLLVLLWALLALVTCGVTAGIRLLVGGHS